MNTYLIWLEWPEKCFRTSAEALSALRSLAPAGARIVRARSEKGFLKALPSATHVLTWHFRSEWFALAPRLRLLATPAAGRELVPKEGPPGVTIHFGGFHGGVMAESVLAMMLAWCRGVVAAERLGPWPKIALSGMCYRLAGTRAVILGYGRIGKALHKYLNTFTKNITICARSEEARCCAFLNGAESIDFLKLNNLIKFDYIINTVPHPVLNKKELSSVSKSALLIDLASFPGGISLSL